MSAAPDRLLDGTADDFGPCEAADAKAHWCRFKRMSLLRAVHRMNAYIPYLLMQRQGPR